MVTNADSFPSTSRRRLAVSEDFGSVTSAAARSSGFSEQQVRHDYWLTRGLWGVAQNLANDEWIRRRPDSQSLARGLGASDMPAVARWAFGGGTSLAVAWGLTDRFSEDLDASLFPASSDVSRSALQKARQDVARWISGETGARRESGGRGVVRTTRMVLPSQAMFKMDAVVHHPDPARALSRRVVVQSIIGRTFPNLMHSYPELGGFGLPTVIVPFTAVNKLDALHRRAEAGDLISLVGRVRDIHDLGAIANSNHAQETSARIVSLVPSMVVVAGPQASRPQRGYGSADLYRPGSLAYEVLREAYNNELAGLLPAGRPLAGFGSTMEAISRLDRH